MTYSGLDLTCIRGERVVFQRLSFAISAGQALVLKGPNGCGKTTLLRLAAGLLKPTEGCLSWQDENENLHDRMHYIGHLDAVKSALTVAENLSFWATFEGGHKAQADCLHALRHLRLDHLTEVPGRYLSAGQRRRLNIARLATSKKPLWLLDEPTVSLDETSVLGLTKLIAEHRKQGGMVMLATHIDLGLDQTDTLKLEKFGMA